MDRKTNELDVLHVKDFETYNDFLQCDPSCLPPNHPVLRLTTYCAALVAVRFGRPDLSEDLAQEMLISLWMHSDYKGAASLKTYIITSMARKMPRLSGPIVKGDFFFKTVDDRGSSIVAHNPLLFESIDVDHTDDRGLAWEQKFEDQSALKFVQDVYDRVFDEYMSKEMIKKPQMTQVVWTIISQQLAIGEAVSERWLAEHASARLHRPVTRYQVQAALKQLRPIVDRYLER